LAKILLTEGKEVEMHMGLVLQN